jgi:Replication-relaxation
MTGNRRDQCSTQMSALRVNGQAPHLVGAAKSKKSARDSVGQPNGKVRREYVTTLKAQAVVKSLSDRDLQIIDTLSIVHLASGRQLQILHFGEGRSAARMARRQLQSLTDHGVLTRLERRPRGVRGGSLGYVYALDVLGQSITGVPRRRRRPRLPGMAFMTHALAVTDCFITLKQLEAATRIEFLEFETEPNCWRDFAGPGGYVRVLKPDAYVVTACGEWEDRWLIEVDRATESRARLRTKLLTHTAYYQSGREQAQSGIFPLVLWVVPDTARRDVVLEVVSSLPAEHRQLFAVCSDDQFADAITTGAATASEVSP